MTAIVFHDGKLIGDRKQVALTNPIAFHDGPKVFISKDKQFAYGCAGDAISESVRDALELKLRVLLERVTVEPEAVMSVEDALGEHSLGNFVHGTLVTRDLQIGLFAGGNRVRRLEGHTHGIGTGGTLLASMLVCGMELKEAAIATNRLDHLTGSKVDVIDTSKLKPFVIKGTTL